MFMDFGNITKYVVASFSPLKQDGNKLKKQQDI